MLKIYLLRHGFTELNKAERVQGWNDSALTPMGEYQAKCAGYGLKDTLFTNAYSGDSLRQLNTAKIFLSENNARIPIIEDGHFREKCYGKWQGHPYIDMLGPIYESFGDTYNGYDGLHKYMTDIEIADAVTKADETGESETTKQVWIRFNDGLQTILNDNSEGNILLSTSSLAISVVLKNLFPDFVQNELVDNCSITVISYDNGKYNLDDYNNIEYRRIGEQHYKKDF